MEYNATYFLNKFQDIPVDNWAVGKYIDRNTGASCALGQCGAQGYSDAITLEEPKALLDLFGGKKIGHDGKPYYADGAVTLINDCVGGDNINGSNTPAQAKEAILCKLTELIMEGK